MSVSGIEPTPVLAALDTHTPYPTYTNLPPLPTNTPYPTYTNLPPLRTNTLFPTYTPDSPFVTFTPLSPLPTYTLFPTITPYATETAFVITATIDPEISIIIEVTAEKTVLRQIKSYNKKGYPIMRVREPRIRYETGDRIQVYATGGEDDGPLYRADGVDYFFRVFDPDGDEEELYVPSWHVVIVSLN